MSRQEFKLAFKVSAKAARLIGRENVANAEGAVVELVKNTYDADATRCMILLHQPFDQLPKEASRETVEWLAAHIADVASFYDGTGDTYRLKDDVSDAERDAADTLIRSKRDIWILDNGHGMSSDIIRNYWMVIGTNFKEENIVSDKGRVRTGAKGIGRFALDRLGSYCVIRSTAVDDQDRTSSLRWAVNWSDFEGSGKVLDEVQATLEDVDEGISQLVATTPALDAVRQDKAMAEELLKWKTGTAIRISGLRDEWREKDVERLFKNLSALIPPEDQRPLRILLLDCDRPLLFGEVVGSALDDFDYRLVARIRRGGTVDIELHRNELIPALLPKDLFQLPQLNLPRFSAEAFAKRPVHIAKRFADWWPEADQSIYDAYEAVGPFDFSLSFYKRGLPAKEFGKYPYRQFQAGPRKAWLDEQGGIKIYRDDFLVRPYGEAGGRAHDWLGLGQRVAQDPQAASNRGWRASPQSLAGTIKISRLMNPGLQDQSNREGLIDNAAFQRMRDIVGKVIEEFESDRSLILWGLNELDKRRNPKAKAKEKGAAAAARVENDPQAATTEDTVALVAAFKAQKEEIDELKNEQGLLRSLSTLGTVVVSFSHELGQLQTSLGGRTRMLEQIIRKIVTDDKLQALPTSVNPITVLRDWDKSDQKIREWFKFALSAVRADKRDKKKIPLKDYFVGLETLWRPFLETRGVTLSIGVEKDTNPIVFAHEIDLDSIFNNLILNSVEAFISKNHTGTRNVSISTSKGDDKEILISYLDTGPGIDPSIESEWRIFDFGQTTKSGFNGRPAGTGIGMWILASIVNEYGGSAHAYRPAKNHGFKIDMRLPLEQKATDA